jgi:hypothetical protein
VISEDVLPKGIQNFAPCEEIGQKEGLNTFGEMNSSGIQETRGGKRRGALGDPFPSYLEAFPWFNLQITMDFERGESEKREERCSRCETVEG